MPHLSCLQYVGGRHGCDLRSESRACNLCGSNRMYSAACCLYTYLWVQCELQITQLCLKHNAFGTELMSCSTLAEEYCQQE